MNLSPEMILGTSAIAIFALLGTFWGKAQTFFQKAFSFIIVPVEIHNIYLTSAVIQVLQNNYRRSWFGIRRFRSRNAFVKEDEVHRQVVLEELGTGGRTYWKWCFPIWVSRDGSNNNQDNDTLKISFFRFIVSTDKLLRQAEAIVEGEDEENTVSFFVRIMQGSNARDLQVTDQDSDAGSDIDRWDRQSMTPLSYKWDELGESVKKTRDPFEFLILNKDQEKVRQEIRHWFKSRDWFRSHGLPWKRGYLLKGPPGTGKTSFARAIGQECDIPVYSFDLSTFNNAELVRNWQSALIQSSRRIVLLEDFDAVFEGRVNRTRTEMEKGVTFDCLLNLIDGADRRDGTLLLITTNHPEKLDPALGGGTSGDITPRPGRIDQVIHFGSIPKEGKKRIAIRIFRDNVTPEDLEVVLVSGSNDSPAQFQERCYQLAFESNFWKEETPEPDAGETFPGTSSKNYLTLKEVPRQDDEWSDI